MRRLTLSSLLLALNAALVALAVVGVAVVATGLLGRLAEEQALARATSAALAGRQAVERSAGEVRTLALLLAERPTVARLLAAGDTAALGPFLDRFRATGELAGCSVVVVGRPLAASPAISSPFPWADLVPRLAAAPAGGGTFLVADRRGDSWLAAAATIPIGPAGPIEITGADGPARQAVTVIALDRRFAARIAGQAGAPVAILPAAVVRAEWDDPRAAVRQRALAGDGPAAARVEHPGRYVAAVPLRLAPAGELPLVEATLPAAIVATPLRGIERRLALLAVLVAALAMLSGVLVGRRLARPVRELTAAAARIGRGDLQTPLPPAAGVEIGTLADTMEEMRRRLLLLTAELRRRQAETETVLSGIAEGVFAVDRDRRIRYLNPQAAALLGTTVERAQGRFCGDVLNPRDADGERPCDERCPIVHARARGSARATEHLLLPSGARRTVVVASSPPTEERQVQVLRDETETEAARRLRDAVLANVSHEFKTPLAAQLASIELLRDSLRGLDAGAAAGLVGSLERGTLKLTQLVDNLLESVRIEAGEDGIRKRPVALDEVVEEAVELTSPLLGLRAQRLAVDLPYPLPEVVGDAPRLTQVFVNLIANANKFAPEGSQIRIGGEVAERSVALWVEDEGPGLPAGAGGELFDRFVRVSDAEAEEPREGGMGLGLWIVKSIVERHGGSVAALPAGSGTRMRVVLPLERVA